LAGYFEVSQCHLLIEPRECGFVSGFQSECHFELSATELLKLTAALIAEAWVILYDYCFKAMYPRGDSRKIVGRNCSLI
jgi:hypothetical protein